MIDSESLERTYPHHASANKGTMHQGKSSYWLKRAIDIIGACSGILFCSPLFLLVAVLIKCDSPGPVFFRQRRVGLKGAVFVMYKFRTMFDRAESKMSEIQSLIEWDGPVFRVKDDPRVTRIGKRLRQFSIDELPQLFNVFAGDMSLVGPRPHLPEEVARYEPWHYKRLACKPGITCLWQVGGRHDLTSEEWIKLDLKYIATRSLWLDFKILVRTIGVVLSGR